MLQFIPESPESEEFTTAPPLIEPDLVFDAGRSAERRAGPRLAPGAPDSRHSRSGGGLPLLISRQKGYQASQIETGDRRADVARTIPMIQAAALMPLIRWMQVNGRPVTERLDAADLGYFPFHDVTQPIPLFRALEMFALAARYEGPDIGCRVVTGASVVELAMMGKVALGARTPREALMRASMALPYFSTHEHLVIEPAPEGVVVRQFWGVQAAPETLHVVQQFVASMIRALCSMTGAAEPLLVRVRMQPDPARGFAHLGGRFEGALEAAEDKALEVLIPARVADHLFRTRARDRLAKVSLGDMPTLRGDGTLAGSARLVIRTMLEDGDVSAGRLADAAGWSVRTLQRRLAEEGASFSSILEDVRRDLAVARLSSANARVHDISSALGYSRQGALTRAVRRWTGKSPSELRASREA